MHGVGIDLVTYKPGVRHNIVPLASAGIDMWGVTWVRRSARVNIDKIFPTNLPLSTVRNICLFFTVNLLQACTQYGASPYDLSLKNICRWDKLHLETVGAS